MYADLPLADECHESDGGSGSYVSVDEHSEFEASQRLQLLAVIQRVGGQLLLHDVIGHQLPHVRSHGQTACETNTQVSPAGQSVCNVDILSVFMTEVSCFCLTLKKS